MTAGPVDGAHRAVGRPCVLGGVARAADPRLLPELEDSEPFWISQNEAARSLAIVKSFYAQSVPNLASTDLQCPHSNRPTLTVPVGT